jgi:hypothetical protein
MPNITEPNLAKVGVEGSNPFARSIFQTTEPCCPARGPACAGFALFAASAIKVMLCSNTIPNNCRRAK